MTAPKPMTTVVLIAAVLAFPAVASAGSCGSAASVTSDLWDEWGEVAKVVGCAGVAAASGGFTYTACYASANKMDKAMKKMVSFWNKMAGNSWAKLGPRRLSFDTWYEGSVLGMTGRVFVSPHPSPTKRVTVKVKKTGGKGKAEVTVCKTDSRNKTAKAAAYTFAASAPSGKEWKKEVKGALDDIITVHIDGKSATKSFKYKVRAKLVNN